MTNETLGARVEQARVARGYSRNQLAQRLAITSATLKKWETDKSDPRANKLMMLSGVLGTDLHWLLEGGEGGPKADTPAPSMGLVAQKIQQVQALQTRLNALVIELEGDVARVQREIDSLDD